MLILFTENVEIIHDYKVFLLVKLNLVILYLYYWILLDESSSQYEFIAEPFGGEASGHGGLSLCHGSRGQGAELFM